MHAHAHAAFPIRRIVGVAAMALLALNSRAVLNGNSIDAGSNGPTWQLFGAVYNDGRVFYPYGSNVSVGGTTTTQFLARNAAVQAIAPALLTIGCATNDLTGTALTPDEIISNYSQMVTAHLTTGGQYVIIRAVMPRTDATWTGLSSARKSDRELVNQRLFELAAASGGRVYILSLESTWDAPNDTMDGLHPNTAGAIKVGEAWASIVNSIMVSGDLLGLYLDASNLLYSTAGENPQLAGTAGGKSGTLVTGSVATGWTGECNDSTITAAFSKTTYRGAEAQNILVGGTNSTNGRVVNFRNAVTYAGVAGDRYEAWIAFKLAAGSTNLRSLAVSCDTAVSPASVSSYVYPSSRGVEGVLRAVVTAPLTGTDTSNNFQCIATFAAGAVAADLTYAMPTLRKIAA